MASKLALPSWPLSVMSARAKIKGTAMLASCWLCIVRTCQPPTARHGNLRHSLCSGLERAFGVEVAKTFSEREPLKLSESGVTYVDCMEDALRSWARERGPPLPPELAVHYECFEDSTRRILCEKLGILADVGRDAPVSADASALLDKVTELCASPRPGSAAAFLDIIGFRGVATLLGIRTTPGSVDELPPSRIELMGAFLEPWYVDPKRSSAKQGLTVGGRAWTKHAVRSSSLWWGDPNGRGGDARKNEEALKCITKIIDEHVWLNVHALPNDQGDAWGNPVHVLELRTVEGYGARWSTTAPIRFRGFVEPQSADGHSRRWRS